MGEVFGRQMGRGIRTWLAEEDSKQRRRRKERKRRYRGGARRREGGVIAESFWGIFLEFRLLRRGVLFGAGFLGRSAGEDILGGGGETEVAFWRGCREIFRGREGQDRREISEEAGSIAEGEQAFREFLGWFGGYSEALYLSWEIQSI